jgi:hypothetical protein
MAGLMVFKAHEIKFFIQFFEFSSHPFQRAFAIAQRATLSRQPAPDRFFETLF